MTSQTARLYSTEGVVLRHFNLGEADRIITLLTPGRGILRAVARGARKPKSKLGGQLDLMRHVSISARTGRNLDSISQAETVESFPALRNDLDLLSRGLYLCELTEKFAVEDAPAAGMFRMLVDGLAHLEQSGAPDLFLRWYEMRLLYLNGFQPQIQRCVDCDQELEPENHTYSPTRGGIACPNCRPTGSDRLLPASVATIKLLRYLRRANWEELDRLKVSDDERRQTERILREHVQFVTDRSIRSAAFMDEVRAQTAANGKPRPA